MGKGKDEGAEMRRTFWTTALAWATGFCMAAGIASATTMLNAWREYGEYFQLGYVVGYIDAVKLENLKDRRTMIPTSGTADFEYWRKLVNEYFADPKNANRSVPDAMFAAGKIVSQNITRSLQERQQQSPSPSPAASSPPASPAASP